MPRVRIPTPLRRFTEGKKEIPAEGRTVAEVLDSVTGRYPGIRPALYDEQGRLQSFVHIYVGDSPAGAGLDLPVPESAEISIVPAIAGGSA